MQLDPKFAEYLSAEREWLTQMAKLFSGMIARIDLLLGEVSEAHAAVRVTEEPCDPFKAIRHWPMTSTTTMGRCREALGLFGREATAKEVRDLIRQQFGREPAKSIVEMLRKRSTNERSGIYRVVRKGSPAKYGLTAWKKNGVRDENGEYVAPEPDDTIPLG